MSKSDKRRPSQVPHDQWGNNWDQTFTRTKWGVWFPKTGKFIGTKKGMQWTYNRAEAETLAGGEGEVVDLADFSKNYDEYRKRASQ